MRASSFSPRTCSTPNPTTGQPTGAGFLWDHGKIQVILTPLGGTQISPYRLNNRGQVVGSANLAGDAFPGHPFLWENGVFTDLGTFGGTQGIAQEVNEAGQVAGNASFPGDIIFHGFLWENGVKTDLVPLSGDPCSQTYGMNSSGQVVGWSGACDLSTLRAVLWEKGGPAIDLNTRVPANSGISLFAATNINDRGEIGGEGVLPNGDLHVFLLIPCGTDNTEGCQEATAGATAATQVSPAPAMQRAPTVNSAFPGATNPMLRSFGRRLMPWYRGLGAQPPK